MIKLICIFATVILITVNSQQSLTAAVDINNNYVIEIVESPDIMHEDKIKEVDININEGVIDEAIKEETKEVISEKEDIDPKKPMIAITFDDGPSNKYTSVILDVLKENNIKATFFVLGYQVKKYEEVIVRIAEEGHELGNHSYNHKKLTLATDEELNEEILSTDSLIKNLTGKSAVLLRPPFGYTSEKFNEKISMPIILWSVDTRDWENRDAEIIKNKLLSEVKDGDIVLMHDIYECTAEAVKEVIPKLKEMGFQLVTVSELYAYREIKLSVGQVYSKIK